MEAQPQPNPYMATNGMSRFDSIDKEKIGMCEIHPQSALFLYCQQNPQCDTQNPYMCLECQDPEGRHPHLGLYRDSYCNKLNLNFQVLFDKTENLNNAVVEKLKQQGIIINWASEQNKKFHNPQNGTARDRLNEDSQELLNIMKQVSDARDRVNQYCLEYKVVEMLEELKMIPIVEEFLQRVDYLRNLDADLVFNEYKHVFLMRNPDISEAERGNQEFLNRHSQLQIRAIFEENDQLKAQNISVANQLTSLQQDVNEILDKLQIIQDTQTF
eukprot:403335332